MLIPMFVFAQTEIEDLKKDFEAREKAIQEFAVSFLTAEFKVDSEFNENMCRYLASGSRDAAGNYTFARYMKRRFDEAGLDANKKSSYNKFWEKYYQDIECVIPAEIDPFDITGETVLVDEKKMPLIEYVLLKRSGSESRALYRDYFVQGGDIGLNLNINVKSIKKDSERNPILNENGEYQYYTILDWLDEKVKINGESSNYARLRTYFIYSLGAKRISEL